MEEATRKRIIAQLADRAVIEGLVESHIPEAWIGLDALAKDLGVPADCIALSGSLAELTLSAVGSVLEPGDVLALAEPCRESWLRGALACGGRFLDVGRDHRLRPMEMALHRALEDGRVDAVLIEHPAVLGGGTLDLPDEHDPFIFVDQSASVTPEVAVDSGVLHLGQTGGVAWVVGTPERLALIEGDHPIQGRSAEDRADIESMAEALQGSRLLCDQPGGVALWARLPGVLGAELKRALQAQDVDTRRRNHPSWREGVALVPPAPGAIDSWARAIAEALSSLTDAE